MKKYQLKQGFALIEILVSAFILTVGLLAIAKLQVYLMQESTLSAEKSKALTESSQMLENIRYNNYQYSNLNIDHIKAANNNSSSANFTFNMLSAATTVADLAQYVTQTKWTDAFGRTQNLYSVSYISSLLQISGSTTGNATRNKSGINPIEYNKDKDYYKDSIVKKNGKEYILSGNSDDKLAIPDAKKYAPDSTDPNNPWEEINFYTEGSLTWYNTAATHGICTIKVNNSTNYKCAPNSFSGITKQILCADQTGPSTGCTAVTEKGVTRYFEYEGKHVLSTNFSCAISKTPADNQSVTMACEYLQGSQLNSVGSITQNTNSTLATAVKQMDSYTMPLHNLGDQILNSQADSSIGQPCVPDVLMWSAMVPKNPTSVVYSNNTAVCYNQKIYIATTNILGDNSAVPPPVLIDQFLAWGYNYWAYPLACTNSQATPEWTTANNANFLTVGQKACYQGIEIYVSNSLNTSGGGKNNNTATIPGDVNSKWMFSVFKPTTTTSPTATPVVTPSPTPKPKARIEITLNMSKTGDKSNCVLQEQTNSPVCTVTGWNSVTGKTRVYASDCTIPNPYTTASVRYQCSNTSKNTYTGWIDLNIEVGKTISRVHDNF